MTNEELSNEFDVLLSGYTYTPAFGETPQPVVLDEYEKSVFLTHAVMIIFVQMYSGANPKTLSFESSEEAREIFHKFLISHECTLVSIPNAGTNVTVDDGLATYHVALPTNLLYRVRDEAIIKHPKCNNYVRRTVKVVSHDNIDHYLNDPFFTSRNVIREDTNDSMKLYSSVPIYKYYLHYIRKPNPVILIDLPDGLEISGSSKKTECDLPETLHYLILNTALQEAVKSKNLTLQLKSQTTQSDMQQRQMENIGPNAQQ